MAKVYAVVSGRKTGLFTDWEEVKGYVNGFPGAIYSGFSSHDKAQEFLDNGGKIEVEKPKLSFSQDLSKVCRVYADETQKFGSRPSFRVCGLIDSIHERNRVFSAWSFEEDYEDLSKLDRLCYAYVHTLKRAYKLGYREFVIVYNDDCLKGWGETWKARSVGAKYYKECLSVLKSRFGCGIHFEKFNGVEQAQYKASVKASIMLDNKSDEYEMFGFKAIL